MDSYFIRTHDCGNRMEAYNSLSNSDNIEFLERVMRRKRGIRVCMECPDESEKGKVSLCILCGDLLDFDCNALNEEIESLK